MKLYYKYLTIERITYLYDELLRITQPFDLNDPFECIPGKPSQEDFDEFIALCQNHLQKNGKVKSSKLSNLKLDEMYENAVNNVNNEIGIFSLTKKWNNFLMWAHYTNSHQGFCIGFDPEDDFFKDFLSTDLEQSKTVKEVIYSKERVQIPMSLKNTTLTYEPFITKSIDWEYEEEIRLIASLNLADKKIIKIPNDIYLFKIPHKAIKEIILGVNINIEKEIEIEKFCIKNKIKLYKSVVSNKYYDMDRK